MRCTFSWFRFLRGRRCGRCGCGCRDNRTSFIIAAFGFGFAIFTTAEQTAVTQCFRTSFVLFALRWRHAVRTTTEFSSFACFADFASFVEWSSGGRFVVGAATEFALETRCWFRATFAFKWLLLFGDNRLQSVRRCARAPEIVLFRCR